MRRIASSRLIDGPAFSSTSRHTSAGSRSSNGLRKLTGAPVAGEFGFGGKSNIKSRLLLLPGLLLHAAYHLLTGNDGTPLGPQAPPGILRARPLKRIMEARRGRGNSGVLRGRRRLGLRGLQIFRCGRHISAAMNTQLTYDFLPASLMRRIASSRLIGFVSANISFQASSLLSWGDNADAASGCPAVEFGDFSFIFISQLNSVDDILSIRARQSYKKESAFC